MVSSYNLAILKPTLMFEYSKMKAELEEFKCPVHKKSAIVTFETGKMEVASYCCEKQKELLDENLSDVSQRNIADIIAEVF